MEGTTFASKPTIKSVRSWDQRGPLHPMILVDRYAIRVEMIFRWPAFDVADKIISLRTNRRLRRQVAKIYWRRNRVFSYCSIGLCVMLLDYMSNGGHFDTALSHRAMLLTAIAVGLQIAWDGYRANRR